MSTEAAAPRAPGVEEDDPAAVCPSLDSAAAQVLHCLVAVLFAGAAVSFLVSCGLIGSVARRDTSLVAPAAADLPPEQPGYTLPGLVQDLRQLASFALGAFVCSYLAPVSERRVVAAAEMVGADEEGDVAQKLHVQVWLM
eukprot:TRINITY_DN41170_c0_g1_i2.p2 TRINITY_DN41170_c0_g1~~TRINITY_DN41170_c0_g1_i2.p2  ORF type:complete len:140 (+),score=32.03 TRINITY_DN41170_c0_g1_i2:141-560(+)